MPAPHPLLDPPAFPVDRYAVLADRLQALFATNSDMIFVQAEAILALEAAASSLGRSGLVALNIVTSPYGGFFGDWLRRSGAEVHEVRAEAGRPVTVAAVEAALAALPRLDLVAIVHAETSSGILNPLPQIAAAVKARGALLVVDAVASAGGHPLDIDGWGIDLCVIGPQKALGGPTALSAVAVSPRAWAAMNPPAAYPSLLSLADIKRNWLDTGRGQPAGMPSALEFWALDAALDRLEAEGLPQVIARHEQARHATHAGLIALGAQPWVADERSASTMQTAAPIPSGIEAAALIAAARSFGVTLTPGFGEVRDRLVRLDHTGSRARFDAVLANVVAYGQALQALGVRVDVGAGAAAVAKAYA